MEAMKYKSSMKKEFEKQMEVVANKYKEKSGITGIEYGMKVRKRLNKSVMDRKKRFVLDVELLSLTQKNCYQMHHFRNLMLSDMSEIPSI